MKEYDILLNKLLIYLYSIDESKDEILNEIIKYDSLNKELNFLKRIRGKIKEDENVEIPQDMQSFLEYENAITSFNKGDYNKCLTILQNLKNDTQYNPDINDIVKERIKIDYIDTIKCLNKTKKDKNEI